ncbi:MAG: thermonuclease family protein [Dolichospermum sp.]
MSIIPVKVLRVYDGDTLLISNNNLTKVVRSRFIDCPEIKKEWQSSNNPKILKHWEWGIKAKKFVEDLIPTNKILYAILFEKDKYDRVLCDLYNSEEITEDSNLQLNLCAAGMASYFLPFQYYDFSSNRELNLFLEVIRQCAIAKNRKVGFWKDDIPLPYLIKSQKL